MTGVATWPSLPPLQPSSSKKSGSVSSEQAFNTDPVSASCIGTQGNAAAKWLVGCICECTLLGCDAFDGVPPARADGGRRWRLGTPMTNAVEAKRDGSLLVTHETLRSAMLAFLDTHGKELGVDDVSDGEKKRQLSALLKRLKSSGVIENGVKFCQGGGTRRGLRIPPPLEFARQVATALDMDVGVREDLCRTVTTMAPIVSLSRDIVDCLVDCHNSDENKTPSSPSAGGNSSSSSGGDVAGSEHYDPIPTKNPMEHFKSNKTNTMNWFQSLRSVELTSNQTVALQKASYIRFTKRGSQEKFHLMANGYIYDPQLDKHWKSFSGLFSHYHKCKGSGWKHMEAIFHDGTGEAVPVSLVRFKGSSKKRKATVLNEAEDNNAPNVQPPASDTDRDSSATKKRRISYGIPSSTDPADSGSIHSVRMESPENINHRSSLTDAEQKAIIIETLYPGETEDPKVCFVCVARRVYPGEKKGGEHSHMIARGYNGSDAFWNRPYTCHGCNSNGADKTQPAFDQWYNKGTLKNNCARICAGLYAIWRNIVAGKVLITIKDYLYWPKDLRWKMYMYVQQTFIDPEREKHRPAPEVQAFVKREMSTYVTNEVGVEHMRYELEILGDLKLAKERHEELQRRVFASKNEIIRLNKELERIREPEREFRRVITGYND